MTHLRKFKLVSDGDENAIITNEHRTCFNGVYPLKIFPQKGLEWIEFGNITYFYGSNGSGKTTLLNIIGEKLNVIRHSEFSNSAFFSTYLKCCEAFGTVPENSQFLSSDDVFDYVMNMRYLNQNIDDHREQLIKGYATMRNRAGLDEEYRQLHGLDDYDRWKEKNQLFLKIILSQSLLMSASPEISICFQTVKPHCVTLRNILIEMLFICLMNLKTACQ